jgi:hypothetical protein
MWVAALLLVVFTGLFSVTSLWLWRHRTAVTAVTAGAPARRGAPRRIAPARGAA